MTYQDETQFVLDLIKDAWPEPDQTGLYGDGEYGDGIYYSDTGGMPETIHRIHRDDSRVLETGNRRRKAEAWPSVNVISAALADRDDEPRGSEYDHDVETVVSCRAVGMHSAEHGLIDDFDQWRGLTNRIRVAILSDRSYPAVEADNDLGYVCYQDLRVENWEDLSSEYRDEYRAEWDVRLTGIEQLPEL